MNVPRYYDFLIKMRRRALTGCRRYTSLGQNYSFRLYSCGDALLAWHSSGCGVQLMQSFVPLLKPTKSTAAKYLQRFTAFLTSGANSRTYPRSPYGHVYARHFQLSSCAEARVCGRIPLAEDLCRRRLTKNTLAFSLLGPGPYLCLLSLYAIAERCAVWYRRGIVFRATLNRPD